MQENTVSLYGIVETVTFHNPDTGWTVLELASDGELHTVVGILPDVNIGEQLKIHGHWDTHSTYGPQIRAESFERYMPDNASAILAYLSSGAIKGVGPATARSLVDKFGDDTLNIIESDYERLAQIKGITQKRAKAIHEQFSLQFGVRQAMLFLSQYGLTQPEIMRAHKKFGNLLCDRVKANPYILCNSNIGISFDRADSIAHSMGISETDDFRLEAAVIHILRHNTRNGHTCLPRDKLIAVAAEIVGCNIEQIDSVISQMIEGMSVVERFFAGKQYIFLQELYRAESYCAERLKMMVSFDVVPCISDLPSAIKQCEIDLGITYNDMQRKAIESALTKGMLVLTGGPGTGKTTILNAIIRLLEQAGESVTVAAPTGRAAKRANELTGCEAKTIHRLLEARMHQEGFTEFERDENNPLDCDALIVDECSMLDSFLFEHLLRALRLGCRLILVGDSNQLPSVGAGNVLHDIIDSGVLPVIALKEVFRQAQSSLIVTNAHSIINGYYPNMDAKDNDFFLMPYSNKYDIGNVILELCQKRLPKAYGMSPLWDIQVLAPGRKGELGTIELNKKLQACLNPPNEDSMEITIKGNVLRVGDKVMQIKNNYDLPWVKDDGTEGLGVFNGDIGQLQEIDRESGCIVIRYDDRTAYYSADSINDLELAYAITVHKSQGSEFEAVIIPAYSGPPQLYYRNLLYTAVTRAKRLLIIVGRREVIAHMVDNKRLTLRYSGLKHMLKED